MSAATATSPAHRPAASSPTLARSSALNLLGSLVQGATNFALIVVVTRRLTVHEAGAFLESVALFTIVSRSAMAGTDVALVRFTSRFLARDRAEEVRTLYLVALVPVLAIGGALGLAMWVLADPIAGLVTTGAGRDTVADHLRVMAPFVPVAAIHQSVESATRGFGTMVPSVVVDRVLRVGSLPVLVALTLAAGGGAGAVALAWAGPFGVGLVLVGLWTVRLLRRAEDAVRDRVAATDRPAHRPLRVLARRFWGFAWPRSFAGVFAMTILWVDTLILGGMAGSDEAATYVSAVRWLVIGNLAANAVSQAFGPEIARVLAHHDARRARRLFQESAALLVLLAVPTYLTAMVFAPYLVSAFGDGYEAGAAVIVITGLGFVLATVAGPVDTLLIMAGRTRLSLINTGVALGVNVVANLVLVPRAGATGAAWAWALTMVVANGLPLLQMHRAMGAHPFGGPTVRNLGVAAAVALALLGGRFAVGTSAAGLAAGLTLGALVVVVTAASSPDRLGLERLLPRADGPPALPDHEDDDRAP